MAHQARRAQLTRRSWLLASTGFGVSGQSGCADGALRMTPRLDRQLLYVWDAGLHFLTGESLELRVADLKDQADMVGDTGLSIRGLVDTLSRPAHTLQPHWTVDVPPFRLGDLKKVGARGPRSG